MGGQDEAAAIRRQIETAIALIRSGDLGAAEPILRALPAEHAHHSTAVQLLAIVLARSGRGAQAESLLHYHLAANPGDAAAHNSLGEIRSAAGKLAEAELCFREALRLTPDFAAARYNLAGALARMGLTPAAIDEYRNCLAMRPAWTAAQLSLADAYAEIGQLAAAIEIYEQTSPQDPQAKDLDLALGHLYQAQGNLEKAGAAYARHAQRPGGGWLDTLRARCLCEPVAPSTTAIDETCRRVAAAVEEAFDAAGPIDAATLHLSAAEPPMLLAYYGRDLRPLMSRFATLFGRVIPAEPAAFGSQKPRVGVVVTAGHEGVFARCLGRLVERLTAVRLDVQVLCFPRGANTLRQMLPGTTLSFFPLPKRIDEAAAQIRAATFDLLYYWELGTDAVNYFLPFFAPAPLQVGCWGWPVTSGNPHVNHYCSARLLEPPDAAQHYTESLVQFEHLPTWYDKPLPPRKPRTRGDFGFRDDEHLYLCTQNVRKYHPDFDLLLREILERDGQGRLVIIGDEQPAITEKLLSRFRAAMPGVAKRICVLPRMDRETYLSVLSLADVVLDTLHYGGGANTVLDACCVGTPIVTLPGAFQRGRWTQAVYRQLGIGETIAVSVPEYVQRALAIGGTPDLRESLQRRIAENCASLYASRAAVVEHEEFFLRTIEEGRSKQA